MIPQDTANSTQHRILNQLLVNKNGLSIDELAKALDVSRNTIQQHFSVFERDNLIKRKQVNKTAGRPVTIYELTDLGINYFPKQYAWFSEVILSDLLEELGETGFAEFLSRLGNKMAGQLNSSIIGKTTPEKVAEAAKLMSDLGFQAQAHTAQENTPVIQAVNCIYHDLAKRHQAVCGFDISLIANLVGKDIEHTRCMAKGDCLCEFKIKPD